MTEDFLGKREARDETRDEGEGDLLAVKVRDEGDRIGEAGFSRGDVYMTSVRGCRVERGDAGDARGGIFLGVSDGVAEDVGVFGVPPRRRPGRLNIFYSKFVKYCGRHIP